MTRTFNTRMVFRTMGALLLIEAVFMTLALGVSLWYGEADSDIFLFSTKCISKSENINTDVLERICKALKCEISDIVEYNNSEDLYGE